MKIVLITGSSGLVGSTASAFFIKKGYNVVGIDNDYRSVLFGKTASTKKQKNELSKYKKYNHYSVDIRNKLQLEKVFKKYKNKIKLIIHSAAQPSHDWAYKDPLTDFDINARSTLSLLNLMKSFCPESTFIFLSTNKVYGDRPNKIKFIEKKTRWDVSTRSKYYNGINENFPIDQSIHSFFGSSKTYADIIVQEFGKNLGFKTGIFRCGCITGPNHAGAKLHGFLSYLVKSCIQKKSYEIIGYKGKQVRDNIHSHDLVNAFWEFFKKPRKGEVYNMGGGKTNSCSIIEAISYVEKKVNIKIKKKYNKKPRSGDHIWYISNLGKFKKHYPNWKVKFDFKKTMDQIIETFI